MRLLTLAWMPVLIQLASSVPLQATAAPTLTSYTSLDGSTSTTEASSLAQIKKPSPTADVSTTALPYPTATPRIQLDPYTAEQLLRLHPNPQKHLHRDVPAVLKDFLAITDARPDLARQGQKLYDAIAAKHRAEKSRLARLMPSIPVENLRALPGSQLAGRLRHTAMVFVVLVVCYFAVTRLMRWRRTGRLGRIRLAEQEPRGSVVDSEKGIAVAQGEAGSRPVKSVRFAS